MKFIAFSVAVVVSALSAAPAVAAIATGSMAASIIGVTGSTASIDVGTTFTNTQNTIVGSGTGDFAGLVGSVFTISPLTASVGQQFSFTSGFGDFLGTVDSASAMGNSANRTVNVSVLGLFTPMGSLSSFDAGPASTTFSFTQTGIGTAVSGSFSFASADGDGSGALVPEPGTWAMMITGFGLVGIAARRKKAASVSYN